MSAKLYVGNLSYNTSEASIKALFGQYGEVVSVNLITDRDGRLLLILEPVTFGDLLSAAFDMLRHASCNNASVLLHMLKVIEMISHEENAREMREQLLCHVSLIQAECRVGNLIEADRQSIHRSVESLRTTLMGEP
jgi:uncharacterized membrane protein